MVAILVALTFIVFVLVDSYLARRMELRATSQSKMDFKTALVSVNRVAGLRLPEPLHYHPGHTWAQNEGRQVVRAGIDDFAAKFLGEVSRVELPKPGRWLRQGERGWTVYRDGKAVDMLSPIEGEVIAVNQKAAANPSLVQSDPYGDGWLIAVSSFAAKSNFKNLLQGRMAHRWMDESVAILNARTSSSAQASLPDGGQPSADLFTVVGEESWNELAREFFLTE